MHTVWWLYIAYAIWIIVFFICIWMMHLQGNNVNIFSYLPILFFVGYVITLFFLMPVFIHGSTETEQTAYYTLLGTSAILFFIFLIFTIINDPELTFLEMIGYIILYTIGFIFFTFLASCMLVC